MSESKILKFLLQDKHIDDKVEAAIMEEARTSLKSPLKIMVEKGKTSYMDLALYLSNKFGNPYLDLASVDRDVVYDRGEVKLDLKYIQNNLCVPVGKKGKILYVVTSDPTRESLVSDLKFQYAVNSVTVIIAEEDKLVKLVDQIIKAKDTTNLGGVMNGGDDDMGDLLDDAAEPTESQQEEENVDDAPIVKFLQKILVDAINSGVSDIHFEPYEKFYRIRYRLDGQLYEASQIPLAIKEKLASRIKVISKLDISEKRIPQDGRLKLVLNKNKAIDFRVSTLPTLHGEKIVMRILDPSSATLGIDALGYDPDQKENLMYAVARPYGMVLVTGPTGSGKTVSLYTCLNILNNPGVNISTAEDPAEINLPGINQVNVNDKAGLSFSAALKSFLRQDPDIIMVGEIRDLETADIAMKAALTGHMVLSTLHTNDAPTTLTRLVDMGVAPFNIASAINLITAQRLGRKLCGSCKEQETLPVDTLLTAGFTEEDIDGYGSTWFTYKPKEGGCDMCKGKGYKGRVGIYQVMPITDEMREVILRKGTAMEVAKIAKANGIKDLRQSGLIKVKLGVTSMEEIEAVTNE